MFVQFKRSKVPTEIYHLGNGIIIKKVVNSIEVSIELTDLNDAGWIISYDTIELLDKDYDELVLKLCKPSRVEEWNV